MSDKKAHKKPTTTTALATVQPTKQELTAHKREFAAATTHATAMRTASVHAVAHRIMLGVELKKLHAIHGVSPGQPKKNSVSADRILWKDLVFAHCQISESTARRIIEETEGFEQFSKDFSRLLKTKAAPEKLLEFLESKTEGLNNTALRELVGLIKPEPPPTDEPATLPASRTLGGDNGNTHSEETEEELRARVQAEWAEYLQELRARAELGTHARLSDETLGHLRDDTAHIVAKLDEEISNRKKGGKAS